VAGARRRDALIRVVDARTGERAVIEVATGERTAKGWARYVAIVAGRFARNFPGAALGADLALISDLPRAAGVSSSSALTVGVAMALARLGGLEDRPEWRANITSAIDLAGYLACVENGMTFGGLAGGGGVGTHSGSEDHTAMLCARPGFLSEYAFVPVQHIEDVALPASWAFVIASSGVPAEKAGAAQALYNRASQSARALLDMWNAAHPPQASLFRALESGCDAALELGRLIGRESVGPSRTEWGVEALERRLAHFLGEDGRVPEAVRAFREENEHRLGVLAEGSQADAETLLGNQIPETSALAHLARDAGAWAACAFGAGFGGSVWALTNRDRASELGNQWMAAYRAEFPLRTRASWFVATPGPAMIEVQGPDEASI
jgi:galactokinase